MESLVKAIKEHAAAGKLEGYGYNYAIAWKFATDGNFLLIQKFCEFAKLAINPTGSKRSPSFSFQALQRGLMGLEGSTNFNVLIDHAVDAFRYLLAYEPDKNKAAFVEGFRQWISLLDYRDIELSNNRLMAISVFASMLLETNIKCLTAFLVDRTNSKRTKAISKIDRIELSMPLYVIDRLSEKARLKAVAKMLSGLTEKTITVFNQLEQTESPGISYGFASASFSSLESHITHIQEEIFFSNPDELFAWIAENLDSSLPVPIEKFVSFLTDWFFGASQCSARSLYDTTIAINSFFTKHWNKTPSLTSVDSKAIVDKLILSAPRGYSDSGKSLLNSLTFFGASKKDCCYQDLVNAIHNQIVRQSRVPRDPASRSSYRVVYYFPVFKVKGHGSRYIETPTLTYPLPVLTEIVESTYSCDTEGNNDGNHENRVVLERLENPVWRDAPSLENILAQLESQKKQEELAKQEAAKRAAEYQQWIEERTKKLKEQEVANENWEEEQARLDAFSRTRREKTAGFINENKEHPIHSLVKLIPKMAKIDDRLMSQSLKTEFLGNRLADAFSESLSAARKKKRDALLTYLDTALTEPDISGFQHDLKDCNLNDSDSPSMLSIFYAVWGREPLTKDLKNLAMYQALKEIDLGSLLLMSIHAFSCFFANRLRLEGIEEVSSESAEAYKPLATHLVLSVVLLMTKLSVLNDKVYVFIGLMMYVRVALVYNKPQSQLIGLKLFLVLPELETGKQVRDLLPSGTFFLIVNEQKKEAIVELTPPNHRDSASSTENNCTKNSQEPQQLVAEIPQSSHRDLTSSTQTKELDYYPLREFALNSNHASVAEKVLSGDLSWPPAIEIQKHSYVQDGAQIIRYKVTFAAGVAKDFMNWQETNNLNFVAAGLIANEKLTALGEALLAEMTSGRHSPKADSFDLTLTAGKAALSPIAHQLLLPLRLEAPIAKRSSASCCFQNNQFWGNCFPGESLREWPTIEEFLFYLISEGRKAVWVTREARSQVAEAIKKVLAEIGSQRDAPLDFSKRVVTCNESQFKRYRESLINSNPPNKGELLEPFDLAIDIGNFVFYGELPNRWKLSNTDQLLMFHPHIRRKNKILLLHRDGQCHTAKEWVELINEIQSTLTQ